MNDRERKEFRESILRGMNLAFERLVEQRRREDDSLIQYHNGEVVSVKAKEIHISSDATANKQGS